MCGLTPSPSPITRTVGGVTDPLELIRQRLGQSVRSLVAGERPDAVRATDEHQDPGYFGPGSAVWTVHSDAAMLVGGVRALLLQTLHPLAMAAVAEHSNYESDPLGRLHRTAQFVGTTTFAPVDVADQAIAVVRSIHDRVQGVAPDGRPYSANDPRLLAWIHITEVDSFLRAYKRYGRPRLQPGEADQYVAQMGTIGLKLGMTHAATSQAELKREIDGFRGELASTEQSRDALKFLTFPPLPLATRGPYAVLLGAAIGLLPRWALKLLGIPNVPVVQALGVRPAATAMTGVLGWALAPEHT